MQTRFWNLPRYPNSHFGQRLDDNPYGFNSDRSGPVYSQFPSSTTPPHKYPSRRAMETSTRNIWRTVTCFTLLGILIGLSIAAAIFVAIHTSIGCDDSSGDSTISTENKLVIPGQATRDDWVFTDELLNPNSNDFRDMQETFCSLVETEFALGNLENMYFDCEVSNFSRGSVIIFFDLTVLKEEQSDNNQIYQDVMASLSLRFTDVNLFEGGILIGADDNCEGNNCTNGAACLDYLASYICICQGNYSGEFCENEITCDPCDQGVTCANNDVTPCPTCEPCSVTGDVSCTPCSDCVTTTCSPATEVTTCEPCSNCTTQAPTEPTPANFCSPNFCVRGQCLNHLNGYHCLCPDGWSGLNCSDEITGLCDNKICQNNGSCLKNNDIAICRCAEGWTGDDCGERLVNLCDPNPCFQNVSCLSDNSDYYCVCELDYFGKNCSELLTDLCAGNSCQSGSTCVPWNDSYICLCPPTHQGENCSTLIQNPCDTSPCNNGTCTVDPTGGDTSYYCVCPSDMTGQDCSTPLPCAAEPCVHGRCLNLYNLTSYLCVCNEDYSGVNCTDNKTLPCDATPCNSTTSSDCLDLEDGTHLCVCIDGFRGQNCSDPIQSVCDLEQPCKNGTCEAAEYTCTCDAGFEGYNCTDEVNDPCEPNPCQNGGVCHVLENGTHICACPNEYTGENCTVNATRCLPDDYPCANGTCYTLLDGNFFCDCDEGFSGLNCSTPSGSAISCDEGYTPVTTLGCFHRSSNTMSYDVANNYCSTLTNSGSTLSKDTLASTLQAIASKLNFVPSSDTFWLEDLNDGECSYYDGNQAQTTGLGDNACISAFRVTVCIRNSA